MNIFYHQLILIIQKEINRTIGDIPTKNDEEYSENDDCFIKFGLITLFEVKTSKT